MAILGVMGIMIARRIEAAERWAADTSAQSVMAWAQAMAKVRRLGGLLAVLHQPCPPCCINVG